MENELNNELSLKVEDFVSKHLDNWDEDFDAFYDSTEESGNYKDLHNMCAKKHAELSLIFDNLPKGRKISGSLMIQIMDLMHEKHPTVPEKDVRMLARKLLLLKQEQ